MRREAPCRCSPLALLPEILRRLYQHPQYPGEAKRSAASLRTDLEGVVVGQAHAEKLVEPFGIRGGNELFGRREYGHVRHLSLARAPPITCDALAHRRVEVVSDDLRPELESELDQGPAILHGRVVLSTTTEESLPSALSISCACLLFRSLLLRNRSLLTCSWVAANRSRKNVLFPEACKPTKITSSIFGVSRALSTVSLDGSSRATCAPSSRSIR